MMADEPLSPVTLSSSIQSTNINENINHNVYEQFDQLAINNNNNRSINESVKPIRNNNSNINRRREQIKSFIEFEDEPNDFDDDNSNNNNNNNSDNCDNYNNKFKKQLSESDLIRNNRNDRKLNEYYKNDLITVFQQQQQEHQTNIEQNSNGDNNNDDNDEEWNDFQRSDTNLIVNNDQNDHKSMNNINDNDEQIQQLNYTNDNNNVDEHQVEENVEEIEEEEDDVSETESNILYGRLNQMEQEQELLNNSLVALTSHFAQVQLRLRQIVEAKDIDSKKRETLLAELETFANRGIPELMLCTATNSANLSTITANGAGTLQRSVSMATSLMADDVFEDDDDVMDQSYNNHNNENEYTNNNNCDSIPKTPNERGRNRSWSSSQQMNNDFADSVHSGMTMTTTTTTTTADRLQKHSNYSMNHSLIVTEEKLEKQRHRQKELIEQLKDQLEDLERYAYETGELNSLPSSMLLERQNVIIEQLKSKLPVLSINEIDQLTPEQLRHKVDNAIKELVNPVLMKEQLVTQLKTQVTDLERFIKFLQQNGKIRQNMRQQFNLGANEKSSNSYLMKFLSNKKQSQELTNNNNNNSRSMKNPNKNLSKSNVNHSTNETAASIFRRILSLLHVFAWTQMGYSTTKNNHHHHHHTSMNSNLNSSKSNTSNANTQFKQNMLKQTIPSCARHWGDLRAHLEIAITSILDFYNVNNLNNRMNASSSNSANSADLNSTMNNNNNNVDFISLGNTTLIIDNYFLYEQITVMVRKELAIALKNLINHGLIGLNDNFNNKSINGYTSNSLLLSTTNETSNVATTAVGHLLSIGMGCFSTKSSPIILSKSKPKHAWQLILYYYELKNGSEFRSMPNRRLSQSFGLQSIVGQQTNPKHSLLAAIDEIIDSHTRMKRSLDSHFKAFVCSGLNQRMLSQWLRLILRNTTIVNDCYEKWSYTASTGFEDALRQLDRLSNLQFCLPIDLAVRQLQSIHDAF